MLFAYVFIAVCLTNDVFMADNYDDALIQEGRALVTSDLSDTTVCENEVQYRSPRQSVADNQSVSVRPI